ncbi:hypothetical protein HK102_011215 [Quaeritorhiza haematococci]|nr:hypothetical protein HK102_011215 [Quaeritorhiza haematococci]
MEEADALGDTCVFMAQGKLQKAGSTLAIKTEHGVGYRLVIKKATSPSPSDSSNPSDSTDRTTPPPTFQFDTTSVERLVLNKFFPSAFLERDTPSDVTYFIPRKLSSSTVSSPQVQEDDGVDTAAAVPEGRGVGGGEVTGTLLAGCIRALFAHRSVLGIEDVDVDTGTLEEVFLKLSKEADDTEERFVGPSV